MSYLCPRWKFSPQWTPRFQYPNNIRWPALYLLVRNILILFVASCCTVYIRLLSLLFLSTCSLFYWSWWPITKQYASDPTSEHIENCYTQELETNSTNKTVKLSTYKATTQYRPKKYPGHYQLPCKTNLNLWRWSINRKCALYFRIKERVKSKQNWT
jgi:hypothetical protein